MATVSVSSKSGLMAALNSADAGDRIVLQAGNYGSLSLNGNSQQEDYTFAGVTIASASDSNPAVFNTVNLSNVTNVTFDGIKFDASGDKPFVFHNTRGVSIVNSEVEGRVSDGTGAGHGLWVINSSDFRLQNTDISDFNTGAHFRSVEGLKVVGNSFDGIAMDAMFFGRIDGALIEGNTVDMNGRDGTLHRDMIQFWNNDINAPSSDVVIRGNTLVAGEGATHGIFITNDVARNGGGLDSYHKNFLIENNTIKSGQVFGILVGETSGLTIRNNTVLQHSAVDSIKPVDIPVIRVENDSRSVSITGNTTHKTPVAVSSDDNWQPVDRTPSGWTIANNRIVSLGADGSSDGGSAPSPSEPDEPVLNGGDGTADEFRYNGGNIDGSERVTFTNVDFREGDRIILSNFDGGTFRHYGGDNVSGVNTEGTYLRINSLVDIQEVITASPDVSTVFQTTNDTLVMRIAQDDGTLDIALPGFAAAYKATFDTDLF